MTVADDPSRVQAPVDEAVRHPSSSGSAPVRRRGETLGAALVAFVLGAGLVGVLAWHGDLARVLPRAAQGHDEAAASAVAAGPSAVPALETRLALLEDRFARLDQQAKAAAGNAGRAEGLLVAQATRRAIERGQPLGYLADQLRLRFAETQPRAVETLIAFAQRPVTLSGLDAQLDALTPQLAGASHEATTWSRVQSALSGLFTIRSDTGPTLGPEERIGRAKLLLAQGQTDAATDTVARLPGGAAASGWSDDARRFGAAQQALDVIESTAMSSPAPGLDAKVASSSGGDANGAAAR